MIAVCGRIDRLEGEILGVSAKASQIPNAPGLDGNAYPCSRNMVPKRKLVPILSRLVHYSDFSNLFVMTHHLHLELTKERILQFHLGAVIAIQVVNVPILWMRYLAPDFFARDTLIKFFSVSSEGKLPTWFSGLTLVACALVLAIIAVQHFRTQGPYRHFWLLLSAIFFYISFDEVTYVHEEIGPLLGDALGASGILAG